MKKHFTLRSAHKTKVFGVPPVLDAATDIPPIVESTVAYLDEHLDEEGLFRISGSAPAIAKLKGRFDAGKKVELHKETLVHNVSGLLKLYLRDMPEPLCTYALYPEFLDTAGMADEGGRLEETRRLLDKLPGPSYATLRHVAGLLVRVAARAKVNAMTTANLATTVAPSVFRPEDAHSLEYLRELPKVSSVFEFVLSHYGDLFPASHALPAGGSGNGAAGTPQQPPENDNGPPQPPSPNAKADLPPIALPPAWRFTELTAGCCGCDYELMYLHKQLSQANSARQAMEEMLRKSVEEVAHLESAVRQREEDLEAAKAELSTATALGKEATLRAESAQGAPLWLTGPAPLCPATPVQRRDKQLSELVQTKSTDLKRFTVMFSQLQEMQKNNLTERDDLLLQLAEAREQIVGLELQRTEMGEQLSKAQARADAGDRAREQLLLQLERAAESERQARERATRIGADMDGLRRQVGAEKEALLRELQGARRVTLETDGEYLKDLEKLRRDNDELEQELAKERELRLAADSQCIEQQSKADALYVQISRRVAALEDEVKKASEERDALLSAAAARRGAAGAAAAAAAAAASGEAPGPGGAGAAAGKPLPTLPPRGAASMSSKELTVALQKLAHVEAQLREKAQATAELERKLAARDAAVVRVDEEARADAERQRAALERAAQEAQARSAALDSQLREKAQAVTRLENKVAELQGRLDAAPAPAPAQAQAPAPVPRSATTPALRQAAPGNAKAGRPLPVPEPARPTGRTSAGREDALAMASRLADAVGVSTKADLEALIEAHFNATVLTVKLASGGKGHGAMGAQDMFVEAVSSHTAYKQFGDFVAKKMGL
eukprot:m51a1_g193 hypothetical protein (844) ;mRNA; f:619349-622406